MTRRKEFSKATKARRFEHCEGLCEMCGAKLHVPQFDYHHACEDMLDGGNAFENCRVICKTCHKVQTKSRAPVLAKVKRVFEKHVGIKKATGWQKTYKGRPVTHKVGGGLVYTDDGEPV